MSSKNDHICEFPRIFVKTTKKGLIFQLNYMQNKNALYIQQIGICALFRVDIGRFSVTAEQLVVMLDLLDLFKSFVLLRRTARITVRSADAPSEYHVAREYAVPLVADQQAAACCVTGRVQREKRGAEQ